MSSIFSGLTREERLLPITDLQTLSATGNFRVTFLAAQSHSALYDHVDHYWGQQRVVQRTQQQYMHTVLRSTKAPIRRVAFPDTRRQTDSVAATTTATTTTSTTSTTTTSLTTPNGAGMSADHGTGSARSAASTPALVAALQLVPMSAPYERLVWPSLLQSPLVLPWVPEAAVPVTQSPAPSTTTATTTMTTTVKKEEVNGTPCPPSEQHANNRFYNTRAPSASSAASPALAQSTLRELCEMAAQHSMPAQETVLFYSLTLTYLDVVIPSGVPVHTLLWNRRARELETVGPGEEAAITEARARCRRALWFQRLLGYTTDGSADTASSSSSSAAAEAASSTGSAADIPQTFQELQARLAQVVLFFQTAAASPEQRTAPSAAALRLSPSTAEVATGDASLPSASPPPRALRSPHRHLAFLLLKLAARHWLERRGATVSTSRQLGCLATAHTARDLQPYSDVLCTGGSGPSHSAGRVNGSTPHDEEDEAAPPCTATGGGDATTDTAALPGRETAPARPVGHTRQARRDADEDVCFLPCESRATPRTQSAFSLSPLPCDPLWVFSVPVCHDALLACMREPMALLTLREMLLVEAGAQCAALVAVRQTQQQHHHRREEEEEDEEKVKRRAARDAPSSLQRGDSESILLGSADGESRRTSLLLRSPSDASLPTQTSMRHTPHADSLHTVLRALVFPLLTRDAQSTSYALYGPQAIGTALNDTDMTGTTTPAATGWRWNDGIGWKGFDGWLLRCYDATGHTPAHHHHKSESSLSSVSAGQEPPSGTLRVRFVEVGLQLTLAQLPTSMEELADLCCRLGARLPRMQQTRRPPLLQFSKPLQQWIMQVFQTHLLDIYLLCKRQRVQAFHLRAGQRGVVLTLLHGDGKEEKVGSPGEVSAEAHAAAAAAAAVPGSDTFSLAALPLVAESGYAEAALWLKHVVDHRGERGGALRLMEWRTNATNTTNTTNTTAAPSSEATEDKGRRAGLHGGSHAVFEPTPPQGPTDRADTAVSTSTERTATSGDGGGVWHQRQVVTLRRAEESVLLRIFRCHPGAVYLAGCGVEQIALDAKDGQLVLRRRCSGAVLSWEMRECYEMKLAGQPLRTPLQSVATERAAALPLPQGVPDAAMRVGLVQMRGMLQYYHRSVVQSARRRQQQQQQHHQHQQKMSTTTQAGGDTAAPTSEARTHISAIKNEENKSTADESVDAAAAETSTTDTKSTTAVHTRTSVVQSQWPEARRTVLFPTDRAMALYVLRHHPHYYTHIRGCGVVEVYVACLPSLTARADPATAPLEVSSSSPSAVTTTAAAAAAAPTPDGTQAAVESATFILERACGTLIPVALESCYTAREPHTLLAPQQLVEAERGRTMSTSRGEPHQANSPSGDVRAGTPSRPSLDLKRTRSW